MQNVHQYNKLDCIASNVSLKLFKSFKFILTFIVKYLIARNINLLALINKLSFPKMSYRQLMLPSTAQEHDLFKYQPLKYRAND